jgi:hypothetical protein
MPACPPKTPDERGDRWEYVAGKALKDWTTRLMVQYGLTRQQARELVLVRVRDFDVTPILDILEEQK